MTTADTLRAARRLIEHPSNWVQGSMAQDEHGDEVDPTSENAVCWCSVGALDATASRDEDAFRAATQLMAEATGKPRESLTEWNDAPARTHADVLWAFANAIALAEGAT
jgi:hypothetical protein